MSISNQVMNNENNVFNIESNTLSVLKETLYPGAKEQSIMMVLNYCKAKKIDPLLKPVHLVPMNVKSGRKDSAGKDIYEWREVVMPGIGLYRIDAARSGQYAGMGEPIFGEDVTEKLGSVNITYPKWCSITVKKVLGNRIVKFTAKEYWKENYATKGRNDSSPNAMWEKRAYGQLAKCAEAQALRKAFPDIVGQDYTKEEMEGKHFQDVDTVREKRKPLEILSNQDIVRDVEKDIMDISWAETLEKSQEVYKDAYKHFMAISDRVNMNRLVDAKDKRKKEIELELYTEVNSETGEIS